MSTTTKALVLTYSPNYCSWTNVSAVYIVSEDFDYETNFAAVKQELKQSGVAAKANHTAMLSEHDDLIRLFHEWMDAKFKRVDFDSVDETN